MATDIELVRYVIDQIKDAGDATYKKMFGEYMVYLNQKPIILLCDNTAYVKMLNDLKPHLPTPQTGFPYKGAKEHYILDPDDRKTLTEIAKTLERTLPLPKPKPPRKNFTAPKRKPHTPKRPTPNQPASQPQHPPSPHSALLLHSPPPPKDVRNVL